MRDDVALVDPWWDLRNPGEPEQGQVQAVTSELLHEASAGHPLYGLAFTVIGDPLRATMYCSESVTSGHSSI